MSKKLKYVNYEYVALVAFQVAHEVVYLIFL